MKLPARKELQARQRDIGLPSHWVNLYDNWTKHVNAGKSKKLGMTQYAQLLSVFIHILDGLVPDLVLSIFQQMFVVRNLLFSRDNNNPADYDMIRDKVRQLLASLIQWKGIEEWDRAAIHALEEMAAFDIRCWLLQFACCVGVFCKHDVCFDLF